MVRQTFAAREVALMYKRMDRISYPLDMKAALRLTDKKARVMTYRQMAVACKRPVQDIEEMCRSSTGATYKDLKSGRYLILYNDDMNEGRIRWTLAHELGHICLGHLGTMGEHRERYMDRRDYRYEEFEREADFFAWNLLAPLPVMAEMGVSSPEDVREIFGLSRQAAAIQYDRLRRWKRREIEEAANGTFKERVLAADRRAIAASEKSILSSFHKKGVRGRA